MRAHIRIGTAFFLALSIADLLSSYRGVASGAAAQTIPSVRQPPALLVDGREARLLLPDRARVRRRVTRLNTALRGKLVGPQRIAPALTLNLFPDVVFTALFDHVEDTGAGRVWMGTLQGAPLSMVALAVVDGALSGHVSGAEGLYEIEADTGGIATVAEIDPTLLPRGAEPLRPPDARRTVEPDPEPSIEMPKAAAKIKIDVATFYTTQAKNEAGGTARIEAAIASAVARTNTAYTSSDISQRIRSVYVGEVTDCTEEGTYADLLDLTDMNDGRMDSVHAIRTAAKADLVALITAPEFVGYCGVAWLLTRPFAGKHTEGFSVTAFECLSEFVYSHELGHNMGAGHDSYTVRRDDENPYGAYSFSLAYLDEIGFMPGVIPYTHRDSIPFMTIMAGSFGDLCLEFDVCFRVPYFSNPRKKINQRDLGTPKADNARTLNNTAPIVAKYSDLLR